MSLFRTSKREICNQKYDTFEEFDTSMNANMRVYNCFHDKLQSTCTTSKGYTTHYKRLSRVTTTGVIQDREEQAGEDDGRT